MRIEVEKIDFEKMKFLQELVYFFSDARGNLFRYVESDSYNGDRVYGFIYIILDNG